eukprot:406632-Pyramimonas_sp.AAC.1
MSARIGEEPRPRASTQGITMSSYAPPGGPQCCSTHSIQSRRALGGACAKPKLKMKGWFHEDPSELRLSRASIER